MTVLRLVLGDQLTAGLSALRDADVGRDVILMAEVRAEATYVRHHKKKIAFLFAAMRHFAEELRAVGHRVRYVTLTDPENRQSLGGEVARALEETGARRVVATECGEYRLAFEMATWANRFGVPVEIRGDDRYLSTPDDFRRWADGRKQLRMEYFYREMRRRHQILLTPAGEPVGGAWNFDKQNRKPLKSGKVFPRRLVHKRSAITEEVLALVATEFADHFGDLLPFHLPVTRDEAVAELDHFVAEILPFFGDHQDAMVAGEPYLYHSLLSAALNAGLLTPLEICRKAEAAYLAGHAPINAVEGFIRQILGWREYVRGLYWLEMPGYADLNFLDAKRPLPAFYWGAPTGMACVADVVRQTRQHAYSHHIQRLMVTGNFALLAGLLPAEVCEWYLLVYTDAYDWVELPNTLGMALYGDGGIMASKPYAASGKYIQRMGNFCGSCRYDVADSTGPKACPFNALYWDFIDRNAGRLRTNQRMSIIYASWDKTAPDQQAAIRARAAEVFRLLDAGEL